MICPASQIRTALSPSPVLWHRMIQSPKLAMVAAGSSETGA
jgi:hypothetical protein